MDQHQQQFKSDIGNATRVVNNQLTQLRMLDKKFQVMDKDFRHKIALNIKSGNNARAKALANELSNIRRVDRTIQNISLALEVIVIRFSTINEFAMIMETINPTIEMIKDIQKDISKVVPTANGILSEITSVTTDVLAGANIKSDIPKVSASVDTDALSILNDVEVMLEEETKTRLPEVPITPQKGRISIDVEEKKQIIIDENPVMVEG
jgi:division protein CdvB (Snf7/Vps24/ESCRT-III family)